MMIKYIMCKEVICPYKNNCKLIEENPDVDFPCYLPNLPEWMTAIKIYADYTNQKAKEKYGNVTSEGLDEVAYINPD